MSSRGKNLSPLQLNILAYKIPISANPLNTSKNTIRFLDRVGLNWVLFMLDLFKLFRKENNLTNKHEFNKTYHVLINLTVQLLHDENNNQ